VKESKSKYSSSQHSTDSAIDVREVEENSEFTKQDRVAELPVADSTAYNQVT